MKGYINLSIAQVLKFLAGFSCRTTEAGLVSFTSQKFVPVKKTWEYRMLSIKLHVPLSVKLLSVLFCKGLYG